MRTVACTCCSQAEVFEARVRALEGAVSSWDVIITELWQKAEEYMTEKHNIESRYDKEKEDVLQCFMAYRSSYFQKEEALNFELPKAHHRALEVADALTAKAGIL